LPEGRRRVVLRRLLDPVARVFRPLPPAAAVASNPVRQRDEGGGGGRQDTEALLGDPDADNNEKNLVLS
jgi:hypothetical protein